MVVELDELIAILTPNRPYNLGGDGLPDPAKLSVPQMRGYVWWCGDEVCDCTQAQIDSLQAPLRTLWRGPFHSDGEMGATEELLACFGYLMHVAPDLAAKIEWSAEGREW